MTVVVVRPALNLDRPSIPPEYGLFTVTIETVLVHGEPVLTRRLSRLAGGFALTLSDAAFASRTRPVATTAEVDRLAEIAREPSDILSVGWTQRIRAICQRALEGDGFADLVRAHRDARALCAAKPEPSFAERAVRVHTLSALVEEVAFVRGVDAAAAEAEVEAAFTG